ncbi:MAG: aminotransferase class IV, partial [Thermodesulfobacteriota bacterium]
MKKNCVYINGRFVSEEKAVVSVFDRGFSYGDGVFETIKAYNGGPAFLTEHMERLKGGVKILGFNRAGLKDFFKEINNGLIKKLLIKNGLGASTARLRITITRGVDRCGFLPQQNLKPTVIITAREVDEKRVKEAQKKGIAIITVKEFRPALPGIKSLNMLPNLLARIMAGNQGASEAVFVNNDMTMREGTTSNIFMVKDGVIKTPPFHGGVFSADILPGVTRGVVLQLAGESGFAHSEERIFLTDLMESDEVFITNSISEVVPVTAVDSKAIGAGAPGPVTRLMQKSY